MTALFLLSTRPCEKTSPWRSAKSLERGRMQECTYSTDALHVAERLGSRDRLSSRLLNNKSLLSLRPGSRDSLGRTNDDLEERNEVLEDEQQTDVGAVGKHFLKAVRELIVVRSEGVEVVIETLKKRKQVSVRVGTSRAFEERRV